MDFSFIYFFLHNWHSLFSILTHIISIHICHLWGKIGTKLVKEQNYVNILMKTLEEFEMISAAKVNWVNVELFWWESG